MTRWLIALGVVFGLSGDARAEDYYKIEVTREDANLYKINGTKMYLRTKYCYEYAMSQDAVLVWKGNGSFSGSQLVFLDYEGKVDDKCDVVSLLVETSP